MANGSKTGGRKKGTPNKATLDIKAYAQKFGKEGIDILMSIARNSQFDAAKVSAVKELFDRGYGKSAQPLTGADGQGPVAVQIVRFSGND